jgi:cytochrome c-type biogenesis protein CcmE
VKIGIGGAVVLSLGTYLVIAGLLPALVYSHPVEDVLRDPGAYVGRRIKIEGKVVEKSLLEKRTPLLEYRFLVKAKDPAVGGEVLVHHVGIVPDTLFIPGAEVVVQGSLSSATAAGLAFESENVLAKCPSKYEGKGPPPAGYRVPSAAAAPRPPESSLTPPASAHVAVR